MISINNATVRFETHESTTALSDISLSIKKGQWVTILGPSGSGKTTLLNVIAGKQVLSEGTVSVDGNNLMSLSETDKQKFRRDTIGFIFQHYRLFEQYTVLENIMIPQWPYQQIKKLRTKAEALAQQTGLGHRLQHVPGQLSGGEKQRTAIARALLNKPKILLCDEPTGNLDAENRERILDLLSTLHNTGITLIVVTHDLEVAKRGDQQLFLRDGMLEQQVTT